MGYPQMLTDTAVRKAKGKDKPYKLFDGHGLFLLVNPNGRKGWRLKYRINGKEKLISLGPYPEVSLAKAREKRTDARKLLVDGIDPGVAKRAAKYAKAEQGANTFEAIGQEWFDKNSPRWSESHSTRSKRLLEKDLYPWLGSQPIAEIDAPELLRTIRRIESRGALDTAHRALQYCGMVFRYAVATGRADRDPSGDLRGALPPVRKKHHASITDPKAIGELLRAIEGYEGHLLTKCALSLAPLVFVRPGELRRAEWDEIDLKTAEWRIPAEKMKMPAPHIVPLSDQAVAVLEEIQPLTGKGKYVFPSVRSKDRPMSENTVNAALRRLGYTKEQMTGHGFRSMASTLLNEQGWHHDAIERQLAHAERNGVRAAYNYAEHLPERRKMMQAWAEYLEHLRSGAEVVPIRTAR